MMPSRATAHLGGRLPGSVITLCISKGGMADEKAGELGNSLDPCAEVPLEEPKGEAEQTRTNMCAPFPCKS